jgi:hypothetical protein
MRALFLLTLIATAIIDALGQSYNLSTLHSKKQLEAYHRTVTIPENDSKNSVLIDEQKGEGVIWLKGISFEQGAIEIDLKGKDEFQKSFLGIAFQGKDSVTYEAVYFRPFNFNSENPERKSHSVQYISHPQNTWRVLRQNSPGVYENFLTPVKDPNAWFHARVEMNADTVHVYVNNEKAPTLVVKRIKNTPGKKLGFWVGDGSGGEFANLKVTPAGQLKNP